MTLYISAIWGKLQSQGLHLWKNPQINKIGSCDVLFTPDNLISLSLSPRCLYSIPWVGHIPKHLSHKGMLRTPVRVIPILLYTTGHILLENSAPLTPNQTWWILPVLRPHNQTGDVWLSSLPADHTSCKWVHPQEFTPFACVSAGDHTLSYYFHLYLY